MKIALKRQGKEIEFLEVDEKYRLECVKRLISCERAEFVRLNNEGTFCIGVDEDGLPRGLKTNLLIDTHSKYFPIQKLVGDVVFVRTKYVDVYKEEIWDYEVESITESDIKIIERILNPEYQQYLQDNFVDYGKGYYVIC